MKKYAFHAVRWALWGIAYLGFVLQYSGYFLRSPYAKFTQVVYGE